MSNAELRGGRRTSTRDLNINRGERVVIARPSQMTG